MEELVQEEKSITNTPTVDSQRNDEEAAVYLIQSEKLWWVMVLNITGFVTGYKKLMVNIMIFHKM